jgi:hypothetical protein
MLEKILDEFNRFFDGQGKAVIINGNLEITIGSQVMVVSLPQVMGWQSKGSS